MLDTANISLMETISFDLAFSSEWSEQPPVISIRNDNKVIIESIEIDGMRSIEFDLKLELDQPHTLEIIRSNHDEVHDQICQLDKFQADGLDVTDILDFAKFYPIYPRIWHAEQQAQNISWPEYHERWREWGWNGTWRLQYHAPFFTWLLKVI